MAGSVREEIILVQVLAAIDQGETLLNALQDAVPEDVRGKLTTAVSAILHAQGTNLKLDRLLDISRINKKSTGSRPKTQEKAGGLSNSEDLHKDAHSSDQTKRLDDLVDGANNTQPSLDKPAGDMGSELRAYENQQKSDDAAQSQSISHQGDSSSLARKSSNQSGTNNENNEFIKEKAASSPDSAEKDSEADVKASITSRVEKIGESEGAIINEYRVDQDVGAAQPGKREDNVQKNEEKSLDFSDQNKTVSVDAAEEASSLGSSSESQPVDRDGNNHQKKDSRNSLSISDENIPAVSDSNPPTFSVSQALDALTGIDDSTQVAVNSVFGVIENMISQLEDEKNDKNDKDEKIDSVYEKQQIASDHMGNEEVKENDHFDGSYETRPYNFPENKAGSRHGVRTGWMEEEHCKYSILQNENDADNSHGKNKNKLSMERKNKNQLVGSKLLADYFDRRVNNILSYANVNPYMDSVNYEYVSGYLLSKMLSAKPLDLDTTTALLLDYYPEDGQWKLLEQPGSLGDSMDDVRTSTVGYGKISHSPTKSYNADNFIEPSYVILDVEKHQEPVEGYKGIDNRSENIENDEDRLEEFMTFVKAIIMDALKVEIDRRVSASDMRGIKSELARDLEKVANAVSLAVERDLSNTKCFQNKDDSMDYTLEKVGPLNGGSIIRAISSAILRTNYPRRILPVGVIVGSSLAALRKFFHVSMLYDNDQSNVMTIDQTESSGGTNHDNINLTATAEKTLQKSSLNIPASREEEEGGSGNVNNESIMIGAVTAALGASALLVQQQGNDPPKDEETDVGSSRLKEKGNLNKEPDKLEEVGSEKNPNNIVTSLAEKAMSVAGPVVPTKEDGEVDQERLVAMLADLGQKGGILRLVGKIALLWGGLRGAMSLTDRLILFLRIAERPLIQRILGFVSMVLVLWSPVVVPLIPTLVRSWTTNNSSPIAELACIVGLYAAVMILVVLWGKRIRGYENPLKQYGLDFTSARKIQELLRGMIGGIMVVLLIQSINALIGCVSFSWPSSLPSLNTMASLKVYGRTIMLTGQGIITATGVVLVEELLFRSWLPEEIAADLGYHRGIIISGLAFSIFQRSLRAIPGLWLLSLALAGAQQRSKGSIFIPIGLRAGIMTSSFVLQTGGFLTYNPNFPLWVTGTHPFEPFSGIVGLAFSLLLAIILYPRQPLERKKFKKV
ncbi:putative leucine-rich repeat-containing protein DDB_G0290503 [Carica papaya]|uniref:putative leucine-rich repeat-containing protein DDB_G0290503 n=1 Tax=Carica papaya TaxID=3649 RepID=UPI000B8C8EC4|nr:putative leucine-rich repeat-containing protein DDB_G0290503 [Carica papaya]